MDVKISNNLGTPWAAIRDNYHSERTIPPKIISANVSFQPACILDLSEFWKFEFFKKPDSAGSKSGFPTILDKNAIDDFIVDESFITDFALKYKEYKDEITGSGFDAETQKSLLDALDQEYTAAIEKAAASLSSSFEQFFDYQTNFYHKHLGQSGAGIFDKSEFKKHLLSLAKGALNIAAGAQDNSEAEARIQSFLEGAAAQDQTLEHMSFNDIKVLAEYFRKLPSLDEDNSYKTMCEAWNLATGNLCNSKTLSATIMKIVQKTASRDLALFKLESDYIIKRKDCQARKNHWLKQLEKAEAKKKKLEETSGAVNSLSLEDQLRFMKRMNMIDEKIKSLKESIKNIKNESKENLLDFEKCVKKDSKEKYQQYQKDVTKILAGKEDDESKEAVS